MGAQGFDIERIKQVLVEATTGDDRKFSQRSLSAAAHESRDCVGDIINGRNKNPTIKVLSNLADALGGDLSIFGLSEFRTDPPTEDELEVVLRDMLPGMPKGALDKRARYLAEAVGRALRLPQGRPAIGPDQRPGGEEAAPPPAATN
ncbi:helix-turn-helix domain-containing protein [Sphingomonas koreensis]